MKGVFISNELWHNLIDYFLLDFPNDDEYNKQLYKEISRQVSAKRETMRQRQLFTQYKQAPSGSVAREVLRVQYLDSVGVLPDWRSDGEFHDDVPDDVPF